MDAVSRSCAVKRTEWLYGISRWWVMDRVGVFKKLRELPQPSQGWVRF